MKPQIGDYCTSYYKGVFKLLDIDYSPGKSNYGLAKLEMIVDSKYNKRGGIKYCDISYCRKVSKEELIQQANYTHQLFVDKINENL